MILYKYRGCGQRTCELLLNRKLYFASPNQLNDPLDSSIDITREYERAQELIHRADDHPERRKSFLFFMLNHAREFKDPKSGVDIGLNGALKRFMQDLGILSFSKNATDALLWSHYADGHRGVCLGFDSDLLTIDDAFISSDVRYLDKPPYVDLFLELTEELGTFVKPWDNVPVPEKQADEFYTRQLSKLMRANLLVKSHKWRYEEEYRMISSKVGQHPFAPNSLREIIRGVNISPSDTETLNNILRHPDYAHVVVRDAVNIPGSFEFGLRPNDERQRPAIGAQQGVPADVARPTGERRG